LNAPKLEGGCPDRREAGIVGRRGFCELKGSMVKPYEVIILLAGLFNCAMSSLNDDCDALQS
jgi:hypothetical protein